MSGEELEQGQETGKRASPWHAWSERLIGGTSKSKCTLISVDQILSCRKAPRSFLLYPILLPSSNSESEE